MVSVSITRLRAYLNYHCENWLHCTNQQPTQRGSAVPDPVWVGSKWLVAFPRVCCPGHSPHTNHFLPRCPVNDRKRAAHSLLEIGRLFSLFSCLSLARLLILLLLIGGNVNPNPGPVFSCLVCAENVTQRRRSVQCCTRSKWIHFRCSLLSFSRFNTLGSSHAWSCPPGFIWRFHTYQHCDFLFGFLQLVCLYC